ncbi:MAG: host attachment protein [Mesorhizobium sp.]|nr:host attachment protein [Mesorhizobium sp.]
MEAVILRPRVWILVADGARARILRDANPPAQAMDGSEELVFRSEQRHLRDIMADKPSRGFASRGRRRSVMEYRSDLVREDNRAFAATLAEVLDSHRRAGDFDRLIVAAAPQMLGDLHQAFSDSLRRVTAAEIAKDFTKLPAEDLRAVIGTLEISRGSMND